MLRAGARFQPTGQRPLARGPAPAGDTLLSPSRDLFKLLSAIGHGVAHDCGLVTTLEAATGWLLAAGVLTAVFGAAVLFSIRAALAQPASPGRR
jgi:hypothetical protein